MIDEYTLQAQEFLKKNGVKLSIRFLNREANPNWGDRYERNHYSVTLTTENGKMRFPFWDSYYNTQSNKRPTAYDVLASLEKYDPGTYEDFCDEFGYEPKYAMELFKGICYEKGYSVDYARSRFKKFCEEIGEEFLDAYKALSIYWAVQEQFDSLQELFTEEQLEELREIN